MLSEITKHLVHYASLVGILGAGLVGLLVFSYDPAFQTAVALALGISFVIWGLVHHHIHEDLHLKVILEYVATAALGVIILLSIIWRV